MVAYSFKQQFRAPILAGTKRQTIRADRKRHVRTGEQLQLYTGMRTRQCAIIGHAVCEGVTPVRIAVEAGSVWPSDPGCWTGTDFLDAFAWADGFADWSEMREFWRREHPSASLFSGVLIRWGALLP